MICHSDTRKKISKRLKEEWKSGIRKNHSDKLAANWKTNSIRKENQSNLFTKTLTKWQYNIYDENKKHIDTCNYQELKTLKLQNVLAEYHRKKVNFVKFKNYYIERIKVKI